MKSLLALALVLLGGSVVFLRPWKAAPGTSGGAQAPLQAAQQRFGPGPEPVDLWNPDRATPVEPAYGGTLTIHIGDGMPPTLNSALTNFSNARYLLYELNAALVMRDWESWQFVPDLATRWEVADTLVAKDGTVRHGVLSEEEGQWVMAGQPVPKDQVARVERGTVFTFHLRKDARWHDGHPFDAGDVLFSWQIAANPDVNCAWVRPYLQKIERAEALDSHTVRFYFREQYFNSLAMFSDSFCILPRHLYDLRDPDHPRHAAGASDAECEIGRASCRERV